MREIGSKGYVLIVELTFKDGRVEVFKADDVNTEDVGYIDFYFEENLVLSANKDTVKMFKLDHKQKEENDNS